MRQHITGNQALWEEKYLPRQAKTHQPHPCALIGPLPEASGDDDMEDGEPQGENLKEEGRTPKEGVAVEDELNYHKGNTQSCAGQ